MIARFAAGSVDVCKAGDLVALHFSTGRGVVVASIPLREFVEKCRGPVDHNLNALPDYEPAGERREARGERPEVSEHLRGNSRSMPPEQLAKYQAALAAFQAGTFRSKRAAANFHQLGHVYSGFVTWSKRQPAPLTDGLLPIVRQARSGWQLSERKRTAYLAAYVEVQTTPGAKWSTVAARHGVSYAAWRQWCRSNPQECAAHLAAARPPITKPGGQLL